jgi:hypothetical protein
MIASLMGRQSLFKNVINSFFLGPLEIPPSRIDLPPQSVLQSLQNTILERSFKGDLVTMLKR